MNRKPRIVIAGQMPPPYGGQYLNIKRLYELFKDSDSYNLDHWRFEFSKHLNELRKMRVSKLLELFRAIQRLVRLRKSGPIDLVIYPTGGPHLSPMIRDILLIPFALLASRRLVIHFRSAGVARAADHIPFVLRGANWFLHKRCWGAISLSHFGKEDPLSLGMTNIFVINNGIEDYNPARYLPRRTRNPVVLHVGHLCPDKGTPVLLKAFAMALMKRENLHLRLVGECIEPYSPDLLKREIERLGLQEKVSWPGLLIGDDLQKEYHRASLLAFPSVAPYESFGMVLIEAMMWGLPLVVSDWRANSEVAGSDFGGIVYKLGRHHVTSLAAALSEAFERESEWPAWSKRNRERYEASFTIERLKADFESFFAKAVAFDD